MINLGAAEANRTAAAGPSRNVGGVGELSWIAIWFVAIAAHQPLRDQPGSCSVMRRASARRRFGPGGGKFQSVDLT